MNRPIYEIEFDPNVQMSGVLRTHDNLDEKTLVHDAIMRGFSAEYIHCVTLIPYTRIQEIADKTISYERAAAELNKKPYAKNADILRKVMEHKERAAEKKLLAIIGC